MKINAEVADENVEAEGGTRRDENTVCVVIRMIEVKRIAETEIEFQSVELRDWPDGVDVDLRSNDEIILRIHFGEIDVVVVFNSDSRAKTEPDRTGQKIVGDLVDRLPPRFRGSFTRQRRSYGILRPQSRAGKKESQ